MMISIIIPALNEEKNIGRLIRYLHQHKKSAESEIIVVDGGSTDNTVKIAREAGATVLISPLRGRAVQMNCAASVANGDILYFVHADTFPPDSYSIDIQQAISSGFGFGRYRTRFDRTSWLLKINAFFTRFDWFVCYGGDQTLFITKDLFQSLKGYDESLSIMEEYDLTVRAKKLGKYKIMPKASLISTRKYDHNSWLRVQKANYIIVKMYKEGIPQNMLVKRYNELIKYH